jgi:hypothetical protein
VKLLAQEVAILRGELAARDAGAPPPGAGAAERR